MAGDDWRGLVGEVELARAAVAIRHEQWEAAETAAEQAVSVFDTYRLPWRRAAALQTWARALTGSGRPSKARARHAEADAVLVAIGAPQRWRTAPDSTRSQRTRPTLEA